MRTFMLSALALGALTTAALAEPVTTAATTGPIALTAAQMDGITAGAGHTPTDPSWGELTRAVAGPALGAHASGEDTPRVGLANIVNQGDLAATINELQGLPLP